MLIAVSVTSSSRGYMVPLRSRASTRVYAAAWLRSVGTSSIFPAANLCGTRGRTDFTLGPDQSRHDQFFLGRRDGIAARLDR
jgi:hypothetical protein